MATAAPETTEARRTPPASRIALVVGLLLLLLGALWFFLLRGEGEPVEAAAPVAPAPVATPTVPAPGLDPGAKEDKGGPVKAFQVFASRDPFEPLIDTSGGAGTTSDVSTTASVDTGGSGDTGGGTGDGQGGGGGASVDGHRVQVIDVYQRGGRTRVQVEVDGTVYTVAKGDTFADSFELVSAAGECATFRVGDDEFTLCEGEEILK